MRAVIQYRNPYSPAIAEKVRSVQSPRVNLIQKMIANRIIFIRIFNSQNIKVLADADPHFAVLLAVGSHSKINRDDHMPAAEHTGQDDGFFLVGTMKLDLSSIKNIPAIDIAYNGINLIIDIHTPLAHIAEKIR